ncbi:MAG: phospho-N-acetylmuramoyl-pentapeptide-transferase [Phycisphaerales bacterium]|nr:phospho-N-acetylmuramoyl-pentapeptide-transferase [Phycisphaerales bacterium]
MIYLLLNLVRQSLVSSGLYRYVSVLDQIQFRALAAAAVAFCIVLFLGRRTIAFLVRMKIGDTGASDAEALRRLTAGKANTPTMGGVLIAGAVALATLLLADITKYYVQLGLIVLVWLAVLGGFDDWLKLTAKTRGSGRQGLYSWEKLVFQLALGGLIGYFAYSHGSSPEGPSLAHVLNLPFQKTYDPQTGGGVVLNPSLFYLSKAVFIVIATLMIAGMSNAVNITDGMDGLATGISAVVTLGLVVLALVAGSQAAAQYLLVPHIPFADELAVMIGATTGACLGFLWWNCAPAQVFMGDTGSLCLGGLIGYYAIILRQELVVLAMSTVFLTEIASVVLQVGYFKATKGKRIFRCAPYHHHLHLGGWTEHQIVARAWIVSIVLVIAALASIKVR